METDQHRVGPQRERVAHDVEARGQVDGAVRGDGLLDHLGVIGDAVAFGAQVAQVHPGVARRQTGRSEATGGGKVASGVASKSVLIRGSGADVRKVEAVGEGLHHVGLCGGGEALAAVAQRGKDRHGAAGDALHVDFVARVALDAEKKGRAGDLFEAGVLDPEFVGPAGFDGDGGRHAQEMGADERESGFALQDGGFALAFKGGVNDGELPARRGLAMSRSP